MNLLIKLFFMFSFIMEAHAQVPYPTKPIILVVPYAPGGVSDGLARALAQRLSASLKQQVIVENKAGGNTVIGATAVARSPADGHTLLLTAESTLTMNPMMYSKLTYDVEKNFVPIAALASVPQSLVVSAATTSNTLQEFIEHARENPNKLSYATLGQGSTAHLNFELFQRAVGIKLNEIPYKGASVALTDLMGGHVDAMIVSTGLIAPHVKAGKLKALAVGESKRSPLLPEVPTFKEAGVDSFLPSSWFALMGVAGTPNEIVIRLNTEVNRILGDRKFRSEQLDKFALESIGGSPENLSALIKSDSLRWVQIIKDANIKLD